jgi:hypothetical protein
MNSIGFLVRLVAAVVFVCAIESRSAPPLYSGTTYVYYPDDWRSGGPAALHHLHHSLNRLGFNSKMTVNKVYFDPQWSRKINRLPAAKDMAKNDILILPSGNEHLIEAAALERYQARGIRVYGYTLAIQSPGPSDYEREVADQMDQHELVITGTGLEEQTRNGLVSQLPVGHYILEYYQLPMAPDHYILPPVQEFYYNQAANIPEWFNGKENLILVDDDAKTKVGIPKGCMFLPNEHAVDVHFRLNGSCFIAILKGFTKEEMAILYRRAKVVLDLYVNGPERAVQEGVLFDAASVVTVEGNGFDSMDFPLPSFARVDSGNNISGLVLETLLKHYDEAIPEYLPFKEHVLSLAEKFDGSLKRLVNHGAVEFRAKLSTRLLQRSKSLPYNSTTTMEDRYKRERSTLASIISVMYHMPMAKVFIEVESDGEMRAFVNRWQHVFRSMEDFGLFRSGTKRGFALNVVAKHPGDFYNNGNSDFVLQPDGAMGASAQDIAHPVLPVLIGANGIIEAASSAKAYRCHTSLSGSVFTEHGKYLEAVSLATLRPSSLSPNCAQPSRNSVKDLVQLHEVDDGSDKDEGLLDALNTRQKSLETVKRICEGIVELHESPLGRIANVFVDHVKLCWRLGLFV